MATLKAFPKGSAQPIEWALHHDVDPENTTRQLIKTARELVRIETATGWILIEPNAYAAFEIFTE